MKTKDLIGASATKSTNTAFLRLHSAHESLMVALRASMSSPNHAQSLSDAELDLRNCISTVAEVLNEMRRIENRK